MRSVLISLFLFASAISGFAQSWPEIKSEARPGTRWWWPGSAVDEPNLKWNLQSLAEKGIGTVEITPIYGVQNNEQNDVPFLSERWMQLLAATENEAAKMDVRVEMNTGTGWPFGGPWVPIEEAACKAIFADTIISGRKIEWNIPLAEKERPYAKLLRVTAISGTDTIDVSSFVRSNRLSWRAPRRKAWRCSAVFMSRTRQKVKRAAPGGEGWVIDHFNRQAVKHYLEHFDEAFHAYGTPFPKTFFNDSYEVYGADWTPTLLDEFKKRRGYDLGLHIADLIDRVPSVMSDYRETLGELLLENFTEQWTAWAHSHGALTRNQAHGSPVNLIDIYAAVDIPEIEGFGLSDFGIRGLRTDSGFTRKNFSDISMLKYASSAAHITGKPLVSSETFTWLTEHFRTSLSQMKPDLDLMFSCGVNHMFFHGTCYSPKDDAWPGWRFYASIDMSPNNSIWRDADALMQYIARCQSVLQGGRPDNDFLVYLPIRDMWRRTTKKNDLLMMFDIHSMKEKAPDFIRCINKIDSLGYDCDYISDRYLLTTKYVDGSLQTAAGTPYKAIIIPDSNCMMTADVRRHLKQLRVAGAHIIFGTEAEALVQSASPEPLRVQGLRAMRRRSDEGYTYFIANLTPNDFDSWFLPTVSFADAALFRPLDGNICRPQMHGDSIRLTLRSGESVILQTYDVVRSNVQNHLDERKVATDSPETLELRNPWTLSFVESTPAIDKRYSLKAPRTWEALDDSTAVLMGTGVYETTVRLNEKQAQKHWKIDLGDVHESARVYINDQYVGCAWAVPFVLDCDNSLKKGKNTLRIEVTNLPANRIAWMDKQGVPWRKMKEINVVDINYKKTRYDHWKPVLSGLNSRVRLVEAFR